MQQSSARDAPTSGKLAVATRCWSVQPSDVMRVQTFIQGAVQYADLVLVAVNVKADQQNTVEQLQQWLCTLQQAVQPHNEAKQQCSWHDVVILPLSVWHGVSLPLNALLAEAAARKCTTICYQSIEIVATKQHIHALINALQSGVSTSDDSSTGPLIAVGASLEGAHHFNAGVNPLNGLTTPWNTLCVYDTPALLLTGWLTVSDGLTLGMEYGVEEVPALSMLMMLAKHKAQTFSTQSTPVRQSVALLQLISDPPLLWQTDFETQPLRQQWQQKKLESKLSRAETHMRVLGIESGVVHHIVERL